MDFIVWNDLGETFKEIKQETEEDIIWDNTFDIHYKQDYERMTLIFH